jgi:hypothetical protein
MGDYGETFDRILLERSAIEALEQAAGSIEQLEAIMHNDEKCWRVEASELNLVIAVCRTFEVAMVPLVALIENRLKEPI